MSKQKIYITGHQKPDTDSVCSAIAYAQYKNKKDDQEYIPVRLGELNPETQFVLNKFDTEKPKLLEKAHEKKLILVDHNEVSQSVKGVEEAEIKGVLDHHRIAGIETKKPIYFHTEPVGSTSTMVADKLLEKKETIDKNLAGLLLSAILSDTVVHRSPTNTSKDEEIAQKLANIIDLNIEEYGKEMLKKKSEIGKKGPREIILGDFKEYKISKNSIGIGQVETVTPKEVLNKEKAILKEMKEILKERNYDLLILLVTDLLKKNSEAYVQGEKKDFEEAFNVEIKENRAFLEGVLSRKKQVVPKLEKT